MNHEEAFIRKMQSEPSPCKYPCGTCIHKTELPDGHVLRVSHIRCAAPLPFWYMKSLVAEAISRKPVDGPFSERAYPHECATYQPTPINKGE